MTARLLVSNVPMLNFQYILATTILNDIIILELIYKGGMFTIMLTLEEKKENHSILYENDREIFCVRFHYK